MSFSAKRFGVNVLEKSRTEHFLTEKCSYFKVKLIKQHLGQIFFSGSRESLPYFSKNPNKNKSALAQFYFYFSLRPHFLVKIR